MSVISLTKNAEKRLSTVKDDLQKLTQKWETTTEHRKKAEQKNEKARQDSRQIQEMEAGYEELIKTSAERLNKFSTETQS